MPSIAIVGAGVAGLGAARILSKHRIDFRVFEKSRGVSGRAASRTVGDVRFDHGANYFKLEAGDNALRRLVLDELPADELIEIPGDVWTFDGDGTLSPGDSALNAEPKYNYRGGISTLGKLLAQPFQSRISFESKVERMHQREGGWELYEADGRSLGVFARVLFTCPSPQALAIAKASEMEGSLKEGWTRCLEAARYHRQFTMVLAYDRDLRRPAGMHAALNLDGQHEISWLAFENDKEGHVQGDQTVVVVQMSPSWSDDHYEETADDQLESVCRSVAELLGDELPAPVWFNWQRWGFAHPYSSLDREELLKYEPSGLHVAGDGLVGKGRVHLALASGLEAGETLVRESHKMARS
ncbi:MAG: FAD-dependent oxidoreductase [Verrucomicrobiota bacterium]